MKNVALSVSCSNNQLQQVPSGISALQALRMLDLSDNPALCPALPDNVASLPSLATLNCSNCGLQVLPDALGGAQQPKLSALSVSGNALTSLPSGLACAGALVVLKASNNKLAELPGRLLKGWTALKELDLSHNQLQVWTQDSLLCCCMLSACGVCSHTRRQCLSERWLQRPAARRTIQGAGHVSNVALGRVMRQLQGPAEHAWLVLMLVPQELPTELGKLPSLAQLDLRNNQLAALPPALGDAGSLCELRVGFNKLSNLPTTLGMLRNLKTLDIRNNLVEVCCCAARY
jgi:Leucine-rich repeat (LRR) protein